MVLYVSNTAPRSARRHLFVPMPKGSNRCRIDPRGAYHDLRASLDLSQAPLAGWCDDAGVSRLRHNDYGRIIFCGYVHIRTPPRIMKVAPASRIRLAG